MVDNKRGTTHIERGTIGPHVPNRSDPHLKSMPRMVECHPDNLVMVNSDGVQLGNPQPSAKGNTAQSVEIHAKPYLRTAERRHGEENAPDSSCVKNPAKGLRPVCN